MNQQTPNLDKQLLDSLYAPVPEQVAAEIADTRAKEESIRQSLLAAITKQTTALNFATTKELHRLKMLIEMYDILVRCKY